MHKKHCERICLVLLFIFVFTPFAQGQQVSSRRKPDVARTTGGVVTSTSAPASRIGRDILARGGNAVDSAVATAFALAVTWPAAGNIGGGGFMMVAPLEGDVVMIDYRETAPAICNSMTFINQKSRSDSKMVGVPGTVRGMELAHKEYGKLPWAQLVKPAADLARNGFAIDQYLAQSINGVVGRYRASGSKDQSELVRVYGRADGRDWKAGDILKLTDLGLTLDRIAELGADEFYTGKTSQLLVDYMQASGGLISADDLTNYRAIKRPAVTTEFRGYTVYGPALPSSGGMTIGMMLNVLDELGFEAEPGQGDWTVDQLHMIAEAMRHGFRERAAHLGDSDFVDTPGHMRTKRFAQQIAKSISMQKATDSRDIAGDIPLTQGPYESPETTHFSVVDADGMTVSNTYTLEAGWGAKVIAPGMGAVLNNEMGDFNWYPGYTNLQGRIGTKANQVAPNKRMLSSMSPTIVKKNGKTILATGSPGGRTIINTVLGNLLQTLVLNRDLPDAVHAARVHHQWLPDRLSIERGFGSEFDLVVKELAKRGHVIGRSSRQGSVHSIAIDPETGVKTGVADGRTGGRVAVTK